MHKPDFRLSARCLRSPAIGLVILTLLCQRLLDALPATDSAAWMINDALRAIPGRLAVPADLAALDMLVGTRWRLIGANCLTLLARRWREDYRAR